MTASSNPCGNAAARRSPSARPSGSCPIAHDGSSSDATEAAGFPAAPPWLDGGPTDTWNLVSLCPKHHGLHHQRELGISGNADEFDALVFTDARGGPIAGSAPPTPPGGPPPNPEVAYEPALLGRFDWDWIGLGWTHPDELERRRHRCRTPNTVHEQPDEAVQAA